MFNKLQLAMVAAMAIDSVSAAAITPRFDLGRQIFQPRATCSEGVERVCYGVKGGTSQTLDLDDIAYAAAYLRFIGQQNEGLDAMWTMPADTTCAEWALPIEGAGTVLALAKHVNPIVKTSILYEELADTIDGGDDPTDADIAASLSGCGVNGGQMGVVSNKSNPAYLTAEYKASKARPDGIIIKLVKAPSS